MSKKININTPIIIDNGTYSIKIGFSNQHSPQYNILNIYGTPKYRNWGVPNLEEPINKPFPIGKNVYTAKDEEGFFKINYPMHRRLIEDFYGMKKIWEKIFREMLKIDPSKHPIFFIVNTGTPFNQKYEISEFFLRKLRIPCLAIVESEPLALFSLSKKYGVIVDLGYDCTSIVSIYEGFPVMNAFEKIPIGAFLIDRILRYVFRARGIYQGLNKQDKQIITKIKEKYSYISLKPVKDKIDLKTIAAKTTKKISNNSFQIGDECFIAPEIIFNPNLLNNTHKSLPQVITQVITNTDEELRKKFYQNILFTGGTSLLQDFGVRMESELKNIIKSNQNFRLLLPEGREYLAWIGASKMISKHPSLIPWISSQDYFEKGKELFNFSSIDVSELEEGKF
ncbi:MAG: hypothetical protein GF317_06585 [Candidatus Lokiarchaeota archaeon]|nr:hypothetical protein [Candidatus Lokiarchaeota archaeon]MBD3199380.1 hypothetical protein [Candidatus Lokiarchaeota archaeon]